MLTAFITLSAFADATLPRLLRQEIRLAFCAATNIARRRRFLIRCRRRRYAAPRHYFRYDAAPYAIRFISFFAHAILIFADAVLADYYAMMLSYAAAAKQMSARRHATHAAIAAALPLRCSLMTRRSTNVIDADATPADCRRRYFMSLTPRHACYVYASACRECAREARAARLRVLFTTLLR